MREAERVQQFLQVDISDNLAEGLTQLAQTGQTIDAVVVALQQLGMTLEQAKSTSNKHPAAAHRRCNNNGLRAIVVFAGPSCFLCATIAPCSIKSKLSKTFAG